jgi:iron complex outermembrane receptor protein
MKKLFVIVLITISYQANTQEIKIDSSNLHINKFNNNSTIDTLSLKNPLILGKVVNSQNEPVSGVTIKLLEADLTMISDNNGQFDFKTAKTGSYNLQATYIGYKTLRQKINIESGKILNLALELIETSTDLKEIVVKGYYSQNEKPVTIGKMPIKPMDLPQSIMTLDKKILEGQQVRSMSDVLMNTNGMYISGATGGYQEEISARGFALGSSNTFKNGMRFSNGMISELSGIEKIEILKGSAAILFGNVAPGGIINLITKKPKFAFGGELGIRSGSWGLFKPTLDIYGGITSNIAARLNASFEQANSFRNGVSSERIYVNPSILVKINAKSELLIEADHLKDDRNPDFGAGIINYKIVDIPRERFLGIPWSKIQSSQSSLTLSFNRKLTDNWSLKLMGGLRQNSSDLISNTRPNTGTLITKDGMWIRNVQKSTSSEDYNIAQIDLTGSVDIIKMRHQMLIGADADNLKTINNAFAQVASYDTVNVFGTKTYQTRVDIPKMTATTVSTSPISRVGLYFQDLIHLSEQIKLLAGIRYSYQQTGSDVLTLSTNKTISTSLYDGAFTPRLGLVFQPNENHSIFASYANSFTLNTGVDILNNTLPPSFIDQFEIGVKNELFNRNVSANLTIYRILNSNLAQTSLVNGNTNSNIKELAGSVQSEGIELDIMTKPIAGISFTAGYSYNETKYIKSNTFIEGSLLRYNPKNTANLGLQYFKNNWKIGLTSVYIGERFAGRSTRITVLNDVYQLIQLPSYFQMDATAAYQFKKITIKGKIGNLTNILSYNVHDDNSVNPIAPRNFNISLMYQIK